MFISTNPTDINMIRYVFHTLCNLRRIKVNQRIDTISRNVRLMGFRRIFFYRIIGLWHDISICCKTRRTAPKAAAGSRDEIITGLINQ